MSIASELTTLAANKAAIKAAIEAKNPATAPTDALAQWPTAIASIPSGPVQQGWIYGYIIDESDSNPATRVSYIEDNEDYDPLYMDFANDALVWGGWKSFVEEYFKPAMLRSDGTIDYYLDPSDLTKKADGVTASDVANTSYDGNAMLIVKPIFYNIGRISPTQIRVRFSNYKQGDDWFNWTHLKSDGTYAAFCGWPLFEGSLVSGKVRSLSGQTPNVRNITFSTGYSYAVANGSGWYSTTFADESMMRMLFPLLCKTTDSESSIGRGLSSVITTGTMVSDGYFYGENSMASGLKFLGMEQMWGSLWRRCAGAVVYDGNLYVKLTPSTADTTTATSFASSATIGDYSGYLNLSYPFSRVRSAGYNITSVSANFLTPILPLKASSEVFSQYYCDYLWRDYSAEVCGIVFGGENNCPNGQSGIFAFGSNLGVSNTYQNYSISLSYHFF